IRSGGGSAVPAKLVGDAVDQGLKGRVDDIGGDTDGVPSVALRVPGFDQHPGDRVGAAGEDADLVVDQVQVLDVWLVAPEILAKGVVEGVDRAIALAHRQKPLAIDIHLHGRLRHGDEVAQGVVPALDHDAKAFNVEIDRHRAQGTPGEELEGGVG